MCGRKGGRMPWASVRVGYKPQIDHDVIVFVTFVRLDLAFSIVTRF